MALKIVVFALLLSICKVNSQSYGCSNLQQSCSPKIQYQPSCNNNGVKASPQKLQIVPGQNCNLQAISLPQLLSQPYNQQRCQPGIDFPKQDFQVTSKTQIPSSFAQCSQPQPCDCNPSVITAPVSTITIPPTSCTTIIDNSLANSLANALQMMIANDFINSAICNNVANQDSCSIPVVETSIPAFDFSSLVKSLNPNQYQQYQCSPSSCYQPNDCIQPKTSDWNDVLNYLNSQYKVPEPEYDYSCFINPSKQKGTASQIPKSPQECYNDQQYIPTCASDIDSCLIEALKAYIGNNGNSCGKSYGSPCGNVAEVAFPDEIPAQLICNYGYMPTTVPVVSFNVEPIADSNCNYFAGSKF